MMPHITGFDIMEQLRQVQPNNHYQPILVLTADITEATRRRALAAGATDFLTKPLDLVEVGLRIKNLLYTKKLFNLLQSQNNDLEEMVKIRKQRLVKTNAELQVAKDKAEAGDQLKTAFIQNISHEVRTPLNGILGFTDILLDDEITGEEKKMCQTLLHSASNRLVNTITDYMDISLLASGNMQSMIMEINVNEIFKTLDEQFREICESRKISLLYLPDENFPNVLLDIDPDFFTKSMKHLLDNAVKFTSKGEISYGYVVNTNSVEFFVKDTGIGIGEDMKELVFNAFTQENVSNTREFEGSGLGLAIIKGLVGIMGGDIRFESQKGFGTIFYLTIPQKARKPMFSLGF